MTQTDLSSVFSLLSLCHSSSHSYLQSPRLLLCPSIPSSASASPTLSFQSSNSVEGPGWSWCPSASSVPSPVAWRGWVPDGAQIQARPGAEAEDPAAGTFSATTPGRPLPHRGLPWGDIWGKPNKTKHLNSRWSFYTQIHRQKHNNVLLTSLILSSISKKEHKHCRPLCSQIMNHHLKLAPPQKCTYLHAPLSWDTHDIPT